MKTKNTNGYLVREFPAGSVECTCGRGNLHTHPHGKGLVLTPLA